MALKVALAHLNRELVSGWQQSMVSFPFPSEAVTWYLRPFLNDAQLRWKAIDPYMHVYIDHCFLKDFRDRLAMAYSALDVMPRRFMVVTGRKPLPNGEWEEVLEPVISVEVKSVVDALMRLAKRAEDEGKGLFFLGD
jgi:hypothetical protein